MPLFWLSLAFMAGIVLSARVQVPLGVWLGAAAASFLLALAAAWWRRRKGRLEQTPASGTQFSFHFILLLLCATSLGAARYQGSQPDLENPDFIAFYNDQGDEIRVTGVVSKPPQQIEKRAYVKLSVESLQRLGEPSLLPVNGYLWVRLPDRQGWQYGDRLQVRGHMETPPEFEDFSYRQYLAQQGVYSYMGDGVAQRIGPRQGNPILGWIYAYRHHSLETVYRLWPDPEASLLAGILLGDESGIPEDVDQAFRDTGTSHVIVISGFNITIIAALLVGLFSRLFGSGQFGVRWAVLLALVGIAFYTILVGGDGAVVRAAIMGSLALFATLLGRRQVGLNTLAFVAAGMAAFTPLVLWNISFQLSFAATLGLVLYADLLKEGFEQFASRFVPLEKAQKWSPAVGEYFLYTLAAQLLVLPVIVYHFQRLSISALIANPLILPVQPALMMLGGLALLAGTLYQPLGQVLAWIAWPFVVYTIRVVELLAGIPGGAVSLGELSLLVVFAFYTLLFALTFAGRHFERIRAGIKPGIALAGLSVLSVLVWRLVMSAPDGRLHMTLLDVGTGDGILIQTPAGRSLLIDGGPSQRSLSDALGRRLPLGTRRLDWLVIAASGEQQLAGVEKNLDRFAVGKVLWAGPQPGGRSAQDLHAYLVQEGIPETAADTGQVLNLGEGASLVVLESCPRGAVLLLEWDRFRVLLPVGMDFETLEHLQTHEELREITALLLADSGYAPINPKEWFDFLAPHMLLLSVAAGDREGLPSQETLNVVQGYNLLRTDQDGWIELTTDGKQVWVEVERR